MGTQIKLSSDNHKGKKVVLLQFEYNSQIVNLLKQHFPARWSQTKKCWWIARQEFDFKMFKQVFSPICDIQFSKKQNEEEIKIQLPKRYLEKLVIVRYSDSTKRVYSKYFNDFQKAFINYDLDEITIPEINEYIHELVDTQSISESQQNQRINAIKFYYEKVLGRNKEYYKLDRPKKTRSLPKIISEDEILKMLSVTMNLKHKAVIATIYSAGLRRSELIALRKQDIWFEKKIIFIKAAKGKKDRTSILSECK